MNAHTAMTSTTQTSEPYDSSTQHGSSQRGGSQHGAEPAFAGVRLAVIARADAADATDLGYREKIRSAVAHIPGLDHDVDATLRWAIDVGSWAPLPGAGRTALLWELLASSAAVDVAAARVLEPHLDALAILAQSPTPVDLELIDAGPGSTWGVYAAEGAGHRLTATVHGSGFRLNGSKPWCSLAREASHALVTARRESGERQLFAVNLRDAGVTAQPGPWHSRGLSQIVSAPVQFDSVPAVPVAEPGWYLTRPGFAWGGMGVAACWWGGAVGVARTLYESARMREPDQIALAHLGSVDASLSAARAVLADAACELDAGARVAGEGDSRAGVWPETTATVASNAPAAKRAESIRAHRVRNLVASTVDAVLTHTAHSLGPTPLAVDDEHARLVADLAIYVRQHHAERDEANLGRDLVANGDLPW